MTSTDVDKASNETSRQSGDTFSWGCPLSAVVLVMALMYASYIDAPLIGIFLFLLTALLLIIFLLVGLVALIREKFKRAAALLLGPLVFIPMYGFGLGWMLAVPFDLVRFYYHRDEYAAVINALPPAERASRVLFFDWGSAGLAVTATSQYWLVYDESGEVALPEAERSQAWRDRARREKLYFSDEKCTTWAYRLSGHYYSAGINCPY